MKTSVAVAFLFASTMAGPAYGEPPRPALARTVDHADTMHGTSVSDPYRWMENVEDEEVTRWAAAQNELAEAFAGDGVSARAQRIRGYSDTITIRQLVKAGERTFFLRGWAGSPYQGLYVGDPNGQARRLDGGEISRDVSAVEIRESTNAFHPSPDGRFVLSMTAPRGSNWGELRLIDVESGQVLARRPDVQIGFSFVDWLPDGSGYVYSAYDREEDAPVRGRVLLVRRSGEEQVVFDPIEDGPGRHRVLVPRTARDGNRLFVEALSGSSGLSDLYVLNLSGGSGTPVKLSDADGIWSLLGARGEQAWVYTNAGAANGRIVRIDGLSGSGTIQTVIPEGAGAISAGSQVGGNAIGMFGDRIALLYREDAKPLVRVFDLEGRLASEFEVPITGSIWSGFHGDPAKPELFYQFLGVSEPSSIYRLDLTSGERELVTAGSGGVRPDDIHGERIFVERPDGSRVPVILAWRRGLTFDRPRKLMMYGYGAFGWVSFLWYQPHVVDWLMNDDGVFAVVGVRGGGEFGSNWHEAGRKLNRQNAIDDYIAAAEHLIANGYTSPDLFVANGGSISGGLVGAVLNQRPDLFGAATLDYPVLDLIRYVEFGRARFWTDELGSPADPREFAMLLRTSPYHNLKAGTCYPPTLVRIGENDATVTPMHGYKYTARLQAAQGCSNPVMLDVMEGAGHNYGSNPDEIAKSHAVALEFLDQVLD